MKRLNRILLIFLVITGITLYSGWRFIHSEKFSREASLKVSKILTEKAGAQLSFTGVDFHLFPPSTTFKNVKIFKNDPALLDVSLEAEDLEVAFSYSSFISSEPEINEVSLRKSIVKLKINKKSNDDIIIQNLSTREIFSKYNELLAQMPLRLNLITLTDVDLTVDDTSMYINYASFAPQRIKARVKADISNFKIAHDSPDFDQVEINDIQVLANLEKEEWRVDELKITKGNDTLSLAGKAFNENKLLHLKAQANLNVNAGKILSLLKTLPKEITSINGDVEGVIDIAGVINNPDLSANFNAKNVDTEWIKLDAVSGVVTKKKNLIFAQKLHATKGAEAYTLKKPQAFYDLNNNKFTNFNFSLHLANAYTDTFLFSARDSLETLKGHVTGDAEVNLYDNKAVFTIKDKIQIKNFRLTTPDGKSDILKNSGFSLENSSITINEDFSVNLDIKASMPNSKIQAKGKITNKGIELTTTDSVIDMKSLGPVAGVSIVGSGPATVKVSGPLEAVVFDFNVDWNNFSVVDLNFGKVKAHFTLALKDISLMIHSLDGAYNKSNYTAAGRLGFDGPSEGMDLKVDFKNTTFSDARKMVQLVFKNIKLPVDPEFNFEASYVIKGGFDLPNLKVTGQIRGTELKVAGEDAEKISLNFEVAKSIVSFKQVKITKSRGELHANANINLENNFIDLTGASQGLRLRDFNFYRDLSLEYDGDVFLDFDGSGTTDDFNSKFKVRVANAFIGNMPASASNALFYINSNEILTTGSLLAGKIKVDSVMSFKTNLATIKSSIDTSDLREFLGIFSSHNITDKGISGKVKAQLNMEVSLGSLGIRRFLLDIDQFNLRRGDINLVIDPKFNSINVDEGNVKKWDLKLTDGKEFILSKGRNISNGVILLEHRFALKASLLEIVAPQIEKATGVIRGIDLIVVDKKINVKDFNLYGEDHSLKIKGLPGYITNLDYSIAKKGEGFEITRMNGNYGEGDFKVGGKFLLNGPYPEIALNYQVDKATVPLFKRSSVMVSANGTMSGRSLPYRLSGKVTVVRGEIIDDPADLMKEDKISIEEYKKYLPEKDFLGNKGIVDLNLSFDTANPVVVKNNMAEVYIRGNGQVTGDVLSPELSVRLETIPNVSKFKFKGHDFALNQGYVEIRDRGKNRISDLKFTGIAKINDYDMKLDLSGSISKVNIDLSSEPALSKEDLLSLLTLGVTSDMSKNLEAGERKFVTTVGIGTLLVDQLKINEDLNASLGVKLSVQPEFKEDETALLQGKSAVSEGSTSRLKSATKIKVNKKVNNRVDVSLSSTIGGSLEQKQEMNINYNINKNFSLEGIYEVKPTEDENNTTTPNSLGADLKWRKSF